MLCTLPSCGQAFDPRRRNQIYHNRRCRERAKNLRHVVVRVSPDERDLLHKARKRLLLRRNGRVTPLVRPEVTLTRLIFREAAFWLQTQMAASGSRE